MHFVLKDNIVGVLGRGNFCHLALNSLISLKRLQPKLLIITYLVADQCVKEFIFIINYIVHCP